MTEHIPEQLISRLSEFINAKTGLFFPKDRWKELKWGISAVAREVAKNENRTPELHEFVEMLLSGRMPDLYLELLIKHLTIGETYFFRDRNLFSMLENHLLLNLVKEREKGSRSIRIWSAGCCTGEEPYTVAIILDRLLPEKEGWDITILGTDINPLFLNKARKGIYTSWSFRDTPSDITEKYFTRYSEKEFEIIPSIKETVSFRILNLAEDTYPSPANGTQQVDIIFCRNVLMYFSPELRYTVIGRFSKSMTPDSCMIFSPGDVPHIRHPALKAQRVKGVTVYKKVVGKRETESKEPFENTKPCAARPADYAQNNRFSPEKTLLKPEAKQKELGRINHLLQAKGQPPQYAQTPGFVTPSVQKQTETTTPKKPGPAEDIFRKALECANAGDVQNAMEYCQKAISRDKLHVGAHYLLATIHHEQGRLKDSFRVFRQVLYLDPKFILAHFSLGTIMRREKRFAEAKRHLTNAMTLLENMEPDQVLPHSGGMTAARLMETIRSML